MMFIRNLGQVVRSAGSRRRTSCSCLAYIGLGRLRRCSRCRCSSRWWRRCRACTRERDDDLVASGVPLTPLRAPVTDDELAGAAADRDLSIFVWPWQNERSAILKDRVREPLDLRASCPASSRRRLTASQPPPSKAARAPGRRPQRLHRRVARYVDGHSAKSARHPERQRRPLPRPEQGRAQRAEHGERREDAVALRDLPRRRRASGSAMRRAHRAARLADGRPAAQPDRCPTRASFAWRLGLVLAAANMLLLGIGMSASNPRHASNWNLLFALLAPSPTTTSSISRRPGSAPDGSVCGTALAVGHGGAFALGVGCSGGARTACAVRRSERRRRRRRRAPGVGSDRRMRTVRRLFYVDIVSAVVFVALAFLALFFFIDFVDELRDVGARRLQRRPRRRSPAPGAVHLTS